jgi:hypothetical protein
MDSIRIARSDATISMSFDAGLKLLHTISRLQAELQSPVVNEDQRHVLQIELNKSLNQYSTLRSKLGEMKVLSDFDREVEIAMHTPSPTPIRHSSVSNNIQAAQAQLYGTHQGTTAPVALPAPVQIQRPPATQPYPQSAGVNSPLAPIQQNRAQNHPQTPNYTNTQQQYGTQIGYWAPPHTAQYNNNQHYDRPHALDSMNYDAYRTSSPASLRQIQTPAGWQRDVVEAAHRFVAAGLFAATSHFATKIFGGSHAPWG